MREPPGEVGLLLKVSGQARQLRLDSHLTLLDALRKHLALTGPLPIHRSEGI